jgi:hypothetical protein
MKVVRLSVLHTDRFYLSNVPGTHFCQRLGHSTTERIMSIETSITPQGIDPATFILVAHRLRQMRHHARVVNHFFSLALNVCTAIYMDFVEII